MEKILICLMVTFLASALAMESDPTKKDNLDYSQLVKRMNDYVQKQYEQEGSEYEKINEKPLAEKKISLIGQCRGLAALWAYSHYLSDQPKDEGKGERDDYNFFEKATKILLNGEDLISPKEPTNKIEEDRKLVDRFIQHVMFFQGWAHRSGKFGKIGGDEGLEEVTLQSDTLNALEDTKGRPIIKVLDLEIVCTHEILSDRLDKIMSNPQNMVLIGVRDQDDMTGHLVAAYKSRDGKIFFYDQNGRGGQKIVENVKVLSDEVWEATRIHEMIYKRSLAPGSHPFGGMSIDLRDLLFRNARITVYNFGESFYVNDLNLTTEEKEKFKEQFEGHQQLLEDKMKGKFDNLPLNSQSYKEKFEKDEGSVVKTIKELEDNLYKDSYRADCFQKIKGLLLNNTPVPVFVLEEYVKPNGSKGEEPYIIDLIRLILKNPKNELLEINDKFFGTLQGAIEYGQTGLITFLIKEVPEQFRPQSKEFGRALLAQSYNKLNLLPLKKSIKFLLRLCNTGNLELPRDDLVELNNYLNDSKEKTDDNSKIYIIEIVDILNDILNGSSDDSKKIAQELKEKYGGMEKTKMRHLIQTRLLETSLKDRKLNKDRWLYTQEIKGLLLSELDVPFSEFFTFFYDLPENEEYTIEIIRLIMQYRLDDFKKENRRIGEDSYENLKRSYEAQKYLYLDHPAKEEDFCKHKNTFFSSYLWKIISRGQVKLLKFLYTEVPPEFRVKNDGADGVGAALYYSICSGSAKEYLEGFRKSLEFLSGPDMPKDSKPIKFWLDKVAQEIKSNLLLTRRYTEEEKVLFKEILKDLEKI